MFWIMSFCIRTIRTSSKSNVSLKRTIISKKFVNVITRIHLHGRRFSPGFGRSPNPGLAGDSKPVKRLRQAWLRWMAQYMGYLLVACRGPAVKSRGQGWVSCTHTSP